MPKLWKKEIIHSFFIPRCIKRKWYWLKRDIYILRVYERHHYGDYPDDWYADQWVNKRLCTRSEYLNYKYNSILPKT